MKSAVVLALAGLAMAIPADSGAALGPAPAGCSKSYNGNFEITIVKPSNTKRSIENRDLASCGQKGILTLHLKDGDLQDIDGRTGYIASKNDQFQFDKPVQAGGIYAGEFSACQNGSIALGPTTTFYQCKSGPFYNLYYKNVAAQCEPVNIDIIPCDGSNADQSAANTSSASAKPVSVSTDGQPQATAKPTSVAVVSMYTDGQPQATAPATSVKPAVVSEYTDGQPQATAAATAMSNVTASSPKPTVSIATGGAVAMTAPLFLAGAMALFAML